MLDYSIHGILNELDAGDFAVLGKLYGDEVYAPGFGKVLAFGQVIVWILPYGWRGLPNIIGRGCLDLKITG